MDEMAIQAAGGNMPLLALALVVMLAASVLNGIQLPFGWRAGTERDARLVKALLDISRDGDMDEEIGMLKELISKRVRRAYESKANSSFSLIVRMRVFNFFASMALMLVVGIGDHLMKGQLYVTQDDLVTLGNLAVLCLVFQIVMGAIYMALERWYPDSE